jgi:hypothetical protein
MKRKSLREIVCGWRHRPLEQPYYVIRSLLDKKK